MYWAYGASSHIIIDIPHSVSHVVNIRPAALTFPGFFLVSYFSWTNLGAEVKFIYFIPHRCEMNL